MMTLFQKEWCRMLVENPFDIVQQTPSWAKWMQSTGYTRRLHGDLLNKAIVDQVVDIAPTKGKA